jgi:hypothetical protein
MIEQMGTVEKNRRLSTGFRIDNDEASSLAAAGMENAKSQTMRSLCPFSPPRSGCGRLLTWSLILCVSLCVVAQEVNAAVPKGVFALAPSGKPCTASVLNNPNVDGLSIREDWKDLEPSEGSYNWTFLDSEVARATAAGKSVLLRISTQANKPAWVTAAVTAAGGSFYTFDDNGVTTTIPVFWDPTFLAKKKAMIAALGARFGNNPTVKIVAVSFANATSEDWNVPHNPTEIQKWLAVGYTPDKLLSAGKDIITTAINAFPSQYLTLATGSDGDLDPDRDYVARNVVLWARATWPNRLIVQKNNLASYSPIAPGTNTIFDLLWDSRPDVAGQMLWNCSGDSSYRMNAGVTADPAGILHKAVNIGYGYGMNYIEIYQTDITNLPSEISYAHQVLLGLLAPTDSIVNGPAAPKGLTVHP